VLIAQSFTMPLPNLHAIEFQAVDVGNVSGSVRLELRDMHIDADAVRVAEVPAAVLVEDEWYRFEFDPLPHSADRRLRLDISPVTQEASTGITMRASRGDTFPGGALLLNERERWGDLAFRTHTPARSTLRAVIESSHLPGGTGPIALAALCVGWLGLGLILHEARRGETIRPR
jgi:hypothetical protein